MARFNSISRCRIIVFCDVIYVILNDSQWRCTFVLRRAALLMVDTLASTCEKEKSVCARERERETNAVKTNDVADLPHAPLPHAWLGILFTHCDSSNPVEREKRKPGKGVEG